MPIGLIRTKPTFKPSESKLVDRSKAQHHNPHIPFLKQEAGPAFYGGHPCGRSLHGRCSCHMQKGLWMPDQRHVRLFRNGRNQAVRIPVEFELPGDEAVMHRDGDRLVTEPVRKRGLLALLETMKPLDEDFPEIEDRPPTSEKVF